MVTRHGKQTTMHVVPVAVQVSEGFKNVAALLDYLNVDASNPLAVLTQVQHRHLLTWS